MDNNPLQPSQFQDILARLAHLEALVGTHTNMYPVQPGAQWHTWPLPEAQDDVDGNK